MKTIQNISGCERFRFSADVVPRQPDSGFSLYFGVSGEAGSFHTGVGFYGSGGLVFDGEGSFFGGYQSGRSLGIQGSFFGDEDRMSYFLDGKLVKNNMIATGIYDAVEFDKFGNSQLNLSVEYISGIVTT